MQSWHFCRINLHRRYDASLQCNFMLPYFNRNTKSNPVHILCILHTFWLKCFICYTQTQRIYYLHAKLLLKTTCNRYTNTRELNSCLHLMSFALAIPHYHVHISIPHLTPFALASIIFTLLFGCVSLALCLHNSNTPMTLTTMRLLPWARRGCCGARNGWWSCCARSPLSGSLPPASRRVHSAGQNPNMLRWGLHPTRSAGERR